ncbi:hypothetical protein [Schumannella sp. 10F1B-5-1]|uniref:hypothetical protein n=1 Tax=Schumannella sp. 10F1B-5-1 TaxID=2590780 RepID=UPI0011315399|nr:hypothetical protein [Schumannella sp. 10F1B-5-1]TPW76793.1 hypothetical protein FJ658_02305 [Schumannella sp. 10F1B-5-1]
MEFSDPMFWLGQLLTAAATGVGVVLAFTLERVAERRRQDDAAFWAARHWARATVRMYESGLLITALRGVIYGRTTLKRPEVQMLLTEVNPGVAAWWSRATECLVEAEDSWLPGSDVSRRANAWAAAIDAEFARAGRRWPVRRTRLRRLCAALPEPPRLSHRVVRSEASA